MNDDTDTKINEITSDKGVDIAFEAAGAQPTFNNAINSIKFGGTVTVVAVFGGEIIIDPNAIFFKEANLVWSHTNPNFPRSNRYDCK